jgi:SlyX protein
MVPMPDTQTDPDTDPDRDAVTIDRRLTDLEVKACYTDDLLDHLNRQVAAQQAQIALLMREVTRLRQQLPEDPDGPQPNASEERPPHY